MKEPKIIFENEELLVIDKPAGLAVHGGGNIKEETLADWLLSRYPKIASVGDDPVRPGIVHRLDKEVSGLMVIAKNQKTFETLKDQFKDRDIIKEYIALVHGKLANDGGEINFAIKRAAEGFKMAAMPLGAEKLLTRRQPKGRDQGNLEGFFKAKAALTEYNVIEKFANYSMVRVRIKTGRTHQIRVHFHALGHPLAGDRLYFNKKSKMANEKLGLDRIFLVSCHLVFRDSKGEEHDFSIGLPDELESVLAHLR